MKDIIATLQYPDDLDIIIEVKSLNLGDDNMLTVDYNVINTDPKGTIDNNAIDDYMQEWLKDFADKAVKASNNMNIGIN